MATAQDAIVAPRAPAPASVIGRPGEGGERRSRQAEAGAVARRWPQCTVFTRFIRFVHEFDTHVERVARTSIYCRLFVVFAVLSCMGAWFALFDRVFGSSDGEECDQPLAELVKVNCVILVIFCFQRPASGHLLVYDGALDGLFEPIRVGIFNSLCFWLCLLTCSLNLWMLCQRKTCGYELRRDFSNVGLTTSGVFCWRNLLRGYFPMSSSNETILLLVLALFYPYSVLVGILVMVVEWMRRLVRCARHGRSTRVQLQRVVDDFEKVPFDPEVFREGAPGGHPSTCPICLEEFSASEDICRTRCTSGGHAFHTECLRVWAKRAGTCPLCRQDLTRPGVVQAEASDSVAAELPDNAGNSPSSPDQGVGAEVVGATPLTPRDEALNEQSLSNVQSGNAAPDAVLLTPRSGPATPRSGPATPPEDTRGDGVVIPVEDPPSVNGDPRIRCRIELSVNERPDGTPGTPDEGVVISVDDPPRIEPSVIVITPTDTTEVEPDMVYI